MAVKKKWIQGPRKAASEPIAGPDASVSGKVESEPSVEKPERKPARNHQGQPGTDLPAAGGFISSQVCELTTQPQAKVTIELSGISLDQLFDMLAAVPAGVIHGRPDGQLRTRGV